MIRVGKQHYIPAGAVDFEDIHTGGMVPGEWRNERHAYCGMERLFISRCKLEECIVVIKNLLHNRDNDSYNKTSATSNDFNTNIP
uniref:(California timema) hypothetical protein n=1 Tax=Timema californicum TaxID=61474 RepID=A0A7R9PD83_TIMCA|nr:unnamed protein product [Timema californicum]